MNTVREYAIQAVLGAIQTATVIGGCMFTATSLKVFGYPDATRRWPPLSVFVREWGMILTVVPFAWILGTIWMERHRGDWFSKWWAFGTGLVVLAALLYFFAGTTVSPGSTLIISIGGDP